MTQTPGKRLKSFRENLGMSQARFAAKLSMSQGNIGQVEVDSRPPSPKIIKALSEIYRINADWLLYGRGDMQHAGEPGFTPRFDTDPRIEPPKRDKIGASDFSIDGHNFGLVRRFDVDASAGPGAINQSEEVVEQIAFSSKWLRDRSLSADLTGIIIAKGDSMEPMIPNGAQMLVRFNILPPYAKGVYVFSRNDETYVKQLEIIENDDLGRPKRVLVTSANPSGKNELLTIEDANELRILAQVVTVIADIV